MPSAQTELYPYVSLYLFQMPIQSCMISEANVKFRSGECLNDEDFSILSFDVKEENGDVYLRLPESDELDAVIGTSKWM